MNEQFGEKVKTIFDSITVLQAKDSDLKRDNANINGDSPMGAMLQYGANTAKEYKSVRMSYLTYLGTMHTVWRIIL